MSWMGTLRMVSSPSLQASLTLYADRLMTASCSWVTCPGSWWALWKRRPGVSRAETPGPEHAPWSVPGKARGLGLMGRGSGCH